jgi:hypothetical protein
MLEHTDIGQFFNQIIGIGTFHQLHHIECGILAPDDGSHCQAPGYSGPVRAGMLSNRSILAYLTAVVARQRFVSSLTRQYTSTYTIAVHLVSLKTLLLNINDDIQASNQHGGTRNGL